MPVAIYLRVSTEEQRERQSILTQREFAERYVEFQRLTVHRIYADEGVSGTVPIERRPEACQILNDARQRHFDQLLVYKLDRLGRDTRLILNAVDELEKLGVRVKSMTEEFDTANPTGRLMLTMLSGFATHEREVIRERSVAGTQRVAEAGAWLGGIVPYGYRKVGEKQTARIEVSDAPIPGLAMSEVEVVQAIFRMAAVEGASCRVIASYLNELAVPCAYIRDARIVLRGKRREHTSGIWGPGRVRGIIASCTYRGVHEYGKRTLSNRPVIARAVPAIVSDEVWHKAQATLKANFLFCKRNAKNNYLLRGLIKCRACGHTYVGLAATRPSGKREFYYRCNQANTPQLHIGKSRCHAKAVRGDMLEDQVWADVEAFLRNPEPILEQLHGRLTAEHSELGEADQLARTEQLLEEKSAERSRVVGLFRRGRLDESELDSQLDEITNEEAGLRAQAEELRKLIGKTKSTSTMLHSAQTLLVELRSRLDGPLSWEVKRRLVEVLVAGIEVETIEADGGKQTRTTVNYRFSQPGIPLPLILPRSYDGPVVRVPEELRTIGDHLRKRRIGLKLLQRQVAEQIGVDTTSIFNWEANRSEPNFRFLPAIIRFLGYNPVPEPTGAGESLIWERTSAGISQKEAARLLEVDQSTLAKYEQGLRSPRQARQAGIKSSAFRKPFDT